jgi:hypothetical protein
LAVSDVGNSFKSPSEIRAALNNLIATGETTATAIAKAINMPSGTMSKFRNGRGLPEQYVGPLHMALGRHGAFALGEAAPVKVRAGVFVTGDALCWREGKILHVLPDILKPVSPALRAAA